MTLEQSSSGVSSSTFRVKLEKTDAKLFVKFKFHSSFQYDWARMWNRSRVMLNPQSSSAGAKNKTKSI